MKAAARRLAATATAAVLVALIALAWPLRPPAPWAAAAPTASEAKDAFAFLGWLGFMILALGLLERAITTSTRRPHTMTIALPHLHPLPRPRTRRQTGGGYATTAYPLIPRPAAAPNSEAPIGAQQPEPPRQGTPDVIRPTIPKASNGLAVAILGPVTISNADKPVRRLRSSTRELLCYLTLHPQGAHRDQIVDALWPNLAPERGRHELWRAIGDARKHLGETALLGERDLYSLDSTHITTDVDELARLTAHVEGQADAARRLALLESALALFRGEPLAGTDYLWTDGDIRHLRATRLHLTEQAGQARLDAGDPAGALAAAEQRIADDPCNERLARLAMRAEAALGLRNAVIARHEKLCRQLDQHLGLRPDPETRRVYRQLLGQDTIESAPPDLASLHG